MKENDVNRTRKSIEQRQSKGQAAQIKTLAEMNLLDDFLFGSMVSYPEIGE